MFVLGLDSVRKRRHASVVGGIYLSALLQQNGARNCRPAFRSVYQRRLALCIFSVDALSLLVLFHQAK